MYHTERADHAIAAVLRGRRFETRRALTISLVLVGIGIVLTFPEFFQMFKSE
jgi:hypothetical protein